jgi:flagellar export protein FliJ
MGKFQFRLATLRKLRNAARDQQRAALAEAYRAEQVLAERQMALADEQAELLGLQRAARAGRYLDVNQLIEAQRYEMVLRAKGQLFAAQAGRLAVEVERRRQAVVEADRAVRVLDLLEDRQRRQHRREQQRRDIKELDEVAVTMRQSN